MILDDGIPDQELLQQYFAGDGAALGQLLDKYEGPVFRFLVGMLRDHHAAEDALQETFVQALRKADTADPATFRGWLFTVAHQQAVLLKRRGKRVPQGTEVPTLLGLMGAEPEPGSQVFQQSEAEALRGLLSQLPAPQQAVIQLRVYEGLKFREVAEKLGCPLNTALARMHDGLKTLRTLWEAQHA